MRSMDPHLMLMVLQSAQPHYHVHFAATMWRLGLKQYHMLTAEDKEYLARKDINEPLTLQRLCQEKIKSELVIVSVIRSIYTANLIQQLPLPESVKEALKKI